MSQTSNNNFGASTPSKGRRHGRSTSLNNIMMLNSSCSSSFSLPEEISPDPESDMSINNRSVTTTATATKSKILPSLDFRINNNNSYNYSYNNNKDIAGAFESQASIRWIKRQSMIFAFGMVLIFWLSVISVALSKVHYSSSTNNISDWWPAVPATTSTSEVAKVQPYNSRSLSPPLIRGGTIHSIPLPLPKQKVTVVLMNFSRPRMIRESSMMRVLLSHPNVDEVLLLHSNPKAAFEFVHPKVVNIDTVEHNDEMGLSLRFYFCQLAKNPWVLHLDDDMEFTTEALNELLIEYGRNPRRIVGRFGRDLTPGNHFSGYNSKDRHKSTEVILTKLMVMERDTCSAFFEYAHLVWSDVILHEGEGPLWNGEDIFMSLVANHVYGPPKDGREFNNYAMDWLNVWQADDSLKDYSNGKHDISGGLSGYRFWDWRWWQSLLRRNRHYSYRGRLWQIARDRLKGLEGKTQASSPSSITTTRR